MADGSGALLATSDEGPERLSGCGAGRLLWARCRCGRSAAIDPAPWRAQGLGAAPLRHLEHRLRCLCGARRVRIFLVPPPEPAAAGGGIWIFR